MSIILLVVLAGIFLVDAGIVFGLAWILVRLINLFSGMCGRAGWRPSLWQKVGLALAVLTVMPITLNLIRHGERARLAEDDKPWEGTLAGFRSVALLTDSLEDPNWHQPGECGPRRCQALLYHHAVAAMLTSATTPAVGAELDSGMKLTRYRLKHRLWCPPNEHMDDRNNGRNLEFLAHEAKGECLIAEPAGLADADAVVIH